MLCTKLRRSPTLRGQKISINQKPGVIPVLQHDSINEPHQPNYTIQSTHRSTEFHNIHPTPCALRAVPCPTFPPSLLPRTPLPAIPPARSAQRFCRPMYYTIQSTNPTNEPIYYTIQSPNELNTTPNHSFQPHSLTASPLDYTNLYLKSWTRLPRTHPRQIRLNM